MKARSLLLLAIPFLLTGCDWFNQESEPDYISKMEFGEHAELTNDNYKDYLKVSFGKETNSDSDGAIIKLKFWLSADGYSSLSYYVDPMTFKIKYDYLGNDGKTSYKEEQMTCQVSVAGKISYTVIERECYYRSVANIRIDSVTFSGNHYVAKK